MSHIARVLIFAMLGVLASAARGDIEGQVRRVIGDAQIPGMHAGVSVLDLRTGRAIASFNAETPVIPASNMKLLTTGAALDVLGDDFAFRTEFSIAGDRLVVVGSGDPALGDPAMLSLGEAGTTSDALLDAVARAIADALKKEGVSGLREVVIDDRVFDRETVHALWPRDQLDRDYCAPVSGFNVHANTLDFYMWPASRAGDAPNFRMEPTMPWLEREVENRARTVSSGSNKVGVLRHMTLNKFTLIGEVRRRSEAPDRRSVHEPALLWGQLLAERLAGAGVRIGDGRSPRANVRLVDEGEDFAQRRALAVVSTPLRDIVRLCNVESINLYAEALLKRMGHEVTRASGSWENGAAVLRMVLAERLGPGDASGTTISDGSGMSRGNRVSPGTLTRWLASCWNDADLREAFVQSLPTRGEGTLDNRFRRTPVAHRVHAKSGFINNVYSLSGYIIDDSSGHALAFSIILNDVPMGQGWKAKDLHEKIVQAADEYLSRQGGALVEAQGG